jgi:hypothetical protein
VPSNFFVGNCASENCRFAGCKPTHSVGKGVEQSVLTRVVVAINTAFPNCGILKEAKHARGVGSVSLRAHVNRVRSAVQYDDETCQSRVNEICRCHGRLRGLAGARKVAVKDGSRGEVEARPKRLGRIAAFRRRSSTSFMVRVCGHPLHT